MKFCDLCLTNQSLTPYNKYTMPTYDFQCLKCLKVHEVYRSFKDKLPEKVSDLDEPCCHGNCRVSQLIGVPEFSVKASSSEVSTIGQLAERNSKKIGTEQMDKKMEEYKTKKQNTLKLKDGMSLSPSAKKDKGKLDLMKRINNMTEGQKQRYIKDGE